MRDEAQRQIDLLLQQQEELAPELYRDLALYLQVLREGLLHAVQQACFHLVTQVVPERYNELPAERRQEFQCRLQELVQRAGTLLTVEQLMGLAAQQQRRDHRRQAHRQQRLLDALLSAQAEGEAPTPAPTSASPDAAGSVHLSLDLPVSADLFDRGVPGLPAPQAVEHDAAPQPDPAQHDQDVEALSLALTPPAEPDPRVTACSLPRDPVLQLRWWSHFDRALQQRLRNLSHAVNVEMLRIGLAQGLLPINLLDGVLEGQVEALPAPANLLRLPLPADQMLGQGLPSEVLTLLLRCGDLEFEQPRLRTCRKRLEQRRATLRTMAKRYRRWQRRLSALEAEQQWFQDSALSSTP
jgi:hypothetical protein